MKSIFIVDSVDILKFNYDIFFFLLWRKMSAFPSFCDKLNRIPCAP